MDLTFDSPQVALEYAEHLRGMSFREVLDLDIRPEGVIRNYGNRSYKGGWGVLIEECYFGYKANSSREADLSDIGVEIKATCIDILKSGKLTAGERLSLTMIPYDKEIPASLYDSHLWKKCRQLLLIWYVRVKDKSADPYQQRIKFVSLFTPPAKDMPIIEADYAFITGLVRDGRADELSESLTTYLGAATKGSNAVRSTVSQSFYAPEKKARKRTFAYKQSYMRYVLHHYVMGEPEPESIVSDTNQLAHTSLVSYVTKIINSHIGKSDRQLCDELGIRFSKNKAQWTTIAYRLLGIQRERAAEFDKANIRVRTVRPEQGFGNLKEHVPFLNIDFKDLAEEDDWQNSELRCLLEERTFLFVVFEKTDAIPGATSVLRGCFTWSMPEEILDDKVHRCWQETIDTLNRGVRIWERKKRDGTFWRYENDLPGASEDLAIHVRPRADSAAYVFEDGTVVGDPDKDAEELPDGRWMTRQAFWLNKSEVLKLVVEYLQR